MVSSGFFANAYLLNFDRRLSQDIGKELGGDAAPQFRVLDYVRYVDDIRIVLRATAETPEAELCHAAVGWVRSLLRNSADAPEPETHKMDLNDGKTLLVPYSGIGEKSRVGARMQALQRDLSAPFDFATLQQIEVGLEGLLALATPGAPNEDLLTEPIEDPPIQNATSRLQSVGAPDRDVRDDTLTRFAALRLTRALHQQLLMADTAEGSEEVTSLDALLHETEVLARRLVSAWAKDPSLAIVLRYAFDLFPSPRLLEPVLESLFIKIEKTRSEYERHVCLYVLAEILKAGATETGMRTRTPTLTSGNLEAYRALLTKRASELTSRTDIPWYVLQQAALYLASRGSKAGLVKATPELALSRGLQDYVAGNPIQSELQVQDEVAVALVGYQLSRSKVSFVAWLETLFRRRGLVDLTRAAELISQFDVSLSRLFIDRAASRPGKPKRLPSYLYRQIEEPQLISPTSLPNDRWISLWEVIRHVNNPFYQENALLKLAHALGTQVQRRNIPPDRLTPFTVFLTCRNWDAIQDPRQLSFSASFRPTRGAEDPRYTTPSWCEESLSWMYAVGRLLRAAATGEPDFTARKWLTTDEIGHYRGIRSSWSKRRVGMMHTGTALSTTMAPITPWFTELLVRLLQWPGAHFESILINDWDSDQSTAAFRRIIQDRLEFQARHFGVATNLPVYIYPVQFPLHKSGNLRVVLVQGLCPTQIEVASWFSGTDRSAFRPRQRRHLASILKLVDRQLAAHSTVLGRPQKPKADLILFSELAVHSDDQDLLRQLSDSTGAMLFFGILNNKDPLHNQPINVARWLIPQRHNDRRTWIEIDQGKYHLTKEERDLGLVSWRPYQVLIELRSGNELHYRIAGAICYDATDIALAADLRDISHMFAVPALNKDIRTFDNMIAALNYHMYQHVIITNTGEFGGSTAQAPYSDEHQRLISHVHGNNQIAISIFDVNRAHFGPALDALETGATSADGKGKTIGKTRPAGFRRGSL